REVAEQDVGALALQDFQRLFGGADRRQHGAIRLQDVAHDVEHVGRIIDDQHPQTFEPRSISHGGLRVYKVAAARHGRYWTLGQCRCGAGGERRVPGMGLTWLDAAAMTLIVVEAAFLAWLKIGRAHLNSSHVSISYAVFCLKKKNNIGAKP